MNPWEDLANAVVLRAVEDYRLALLGENIDRDTPVKVTVRECEKFFRSEYFSILTNLDGEAIIEKIKGDVYGS